MEIKGKKIEHFLIKNPVLRKYNDDYYILNDDNLLTCCNNIVLDNIEFISQFYLTLPIKQQINNYVILDNCDHLSVCHNGQKIASALYSLHHLPLLNNEKSDSNDDCIMLLAKDLSYFLFDDDQFIGFLVDKCQNGNKYFDIYHTYLLCQDFISEEDFINSYNDDYFDYSKYEKVKKG
ncbi:MAG: hypothetical protein WBO70_06645 [Erysipelotrichaceae bacterium]